MWSRTSALALARSEVEPEHGADGQAAESGQRPRHLVRRPRGEPSRKADELGASDEHDVHSRHVEDELSCGTLVQVRDVEFFSDPFMIGIPSVDVNARGEA